MIMQKLKLTFNEKTKFKIYLNIYSNWNKNYKIKYCWSQFINNKYMINYKQVLIKITNLDPHFMSKINKNLWENK